MSADSEKKVADSAKCRTISQLLAINRSSLAGFALQEGFLSSMNRHYPVYAADETASSIALLPAFAPADEEETEAAPAPEHTAMPLITRSTMPGTSIRRLRNHRCAWPRRS